MCVNIPGPERPLQTGRRSILKAAGVSALVSSVVGAGQGSALAAASSRAERPRHRTRLVLLGTAGGPALDQPERAGICTAIAYGSKLYLVDLGWGAPLRLAQSGLLTANPALGSFGNVRGIFFTHMHSDHLAEWPTFYGLADGNWYDPSRSPIEVFGPGDRGTLPRVNPPGREVPPVVNPENPTPGLVDTTGYVRQAWANDTNDRIRDSNAGDKGSAFNVHDIDLGNVWEIDEQGKPPRLKAPIAVWTDGPVKVTATLVDHHPTAPAFAYRFDTPDGSVVISGDTTVSPNLIDLAKDCDYLVHEVIDPVWVKKVAAFMPPEMQQPMVDHLLESHTTIPQVGRDVAQPARAKNLVLTHLVGDRDSKWRRARNGYQGNLIVGKDLMQIGVGKPRR